MTMVVTYVAFCFRCFPRRRRTFACCVCLISLVTIFSLRLIITSPFQFLNTIHRSSQSDSEHLDVIPSRLTITKVTARSRSLDSKPVVYLCRILSSRLHHVRTNNLHWQNPADSDVYLYSAFYDNRLTTVSKDGHDYIRIIVMTSSASSFSSRKLYCQLWFDGTGVASVTPAEVSNVWFQDWDSDVRHLSYNPVVLSCAVPKGLDGPGPLYVSVSDDEPCRPTRTAMLVKHYEVARSRTFDAKRFAICVKPYDFSEDLSPKLVEWIELNRILGVDLVHVYAFRMHPNVTKVLRLYSDLGVVRVTTITLPGNQPNYPYERSLFSKRNLWQKRRNELVSYNDCFYEHLYTHEYVIPLDIDELIVPVRHTSLSEMFAYLKESLADLLQSYASFSVKNFYFFDAFAINASLIESVRESYFLRHITRSANFSQGSKSVKSFIRTDATFTVFNHYALDSLIAGVGRSTELPHQLVQMHHYRSKCPMSISNECRENYMRFTRMDTLLWKYADKLLPRIREMREKLR